MMIALPQAAARQSPRNPLEHRQLREHRANHNQIFRIHNFIAIRKDPSMFLIHHHYRIIRFHVIQLRTFRRILINFTRIVISLALSSNLK